MAYNTGNAIGSADARDLYDNAANLDKAMNSSAATWTDRFGVSRPTFKGAESELNEKVAAAAASAEEAAAIADSIDDRYLGSKASDPATDNDGNPLQIGAEYYNTVTGYKRTYGISGWYTPNVDGQALGQSGPGQGADMVGYGEGLAYADGTVGKAIQERLPEIGTYALLRSYTGPVTAFLVRGVESIFDGGAGVFRVDASDTTTADNGGTVLVDASGRRWKRQFKGQAYLAWFGASGDGSDQTDAVLLAFAWLNGASYRTLAGNFGASYTVSSTINMTRSAVQFLGSNCIFTHAVASKQPLFKFASAGTSDVLIDNFKIFGSASSGHVISILGSGTNPQAIKINKVRAVGVSGTGLNSNNSDVAACLVWAEGGSALTISECVSDTGSAGIYLDSVEKVSLFGNVIDNCTTGRALYANNCRNLVITNRNTFNGGSAWNQVELLNCAHVDFSGNRLKGGVGSNIYAAGSSALLIESNGIECYNASSTILIDGSCINPSIKNNLLQVIGANTITGAIIDVLGSTLGYGGTIEQNTIIFGNLSVVNAGIRLSGASGMRGWVIEKNSIGNTATGANVTTGIELSGASGNQYGARLKNNTVGMSGSGSLMTTGISINSNYVGPEVFGNIQYGTNITTFISDQSAKPIRQENGTWKSGSFTPVAYGGSSAGTATYAKQAGRYVQIGNLVFVTIALSWSEHTGTGDLRISGMPFPFSTTADELQALNIFASNLSFTAGAQITAYSQGGLSYLRLAQFSNGAALSFVQMDAAAEVYISGFYEIS